MIISGNKVLAYTVIFPYVEKFEYHQGSGFSIADTQIDLLVNISLLQFFFFFFIELEAV